MTTDHADVDAFGRRLMGVRDQVMRDLDRLLAGQLRHEARIRLSAELGRVIQSDEDRAVVEDLCLQVVDDVIGATLIMIEQAEDVSLTVGQTSLSDWIDGLAGLPYGPEGWIETYSAHPPSPTNRTR